MSVSDYSDINLDAYEQLIAMIKALTFIVEKYPIGTYISNKVGALDLKYTIDYLPYCRLQWASEYKTPFTGSLEQTYQLQDIYISHNLDWNKDPLVVKLLTAYKKI